MKYDFSGYATKADLKCADGRTICRDAFKGNDGTTVPLVWQHQHDDPDNVLGHVLLENRADGVYAYGVFNNSEKGQKVKLLVEHGDVNALSIFANKLKEKGGFVNHGEIKEVSVVLAGANPEAFIDNVTIQHGDSYETIPDEAVIYAGIEFNSSSGDTLFHAEAKTQAPAESGDKTVQDVIATMSEEQKNVMYALVGAALDAGDEDEENAQQDDMRGGNILKHNIFEGTPATDDTPSLSHSDFLSIVAEAQKCGSMKEAFLAHAQTYGIENIDILFPDAKTVTPTPDFISREMEWVQGVISGTRHTPFSRVKSTAADITADEARAKGYVKGNLKKEEIIKLLKRVTTPTTIYKKQKLDRDDIIDITEIDVVSWLKAEMRMMLDEELARAVLVGDGREPDSEDKINEENIRPIYKDVDMYAHHVVIDSAADVEAEIEEIIRARKHYKGSGNPTFYTTGDKITDMLLLKDKVGRRLYNTTAELASALRVSKIVEVPVMDGLTRTMDDNTTKTDLIGIIVNLSDYVMGADRGGNVSMFDDFDIDYNQYKYLIETRCSGALVHPKSALVIEKKKAAPAAG